METIEFDIKDQQARIRLNRPDSLNSFNEAMHAELKLAIQETASSEARVLLITGNGRGFCAGQDLSARKADADAEAVDLGESLELHYNPLMHSLMRLDIPVVCALNGVAAGAGVSLALASDFMLMHKSAMLVMAFNRLGLVPDSGCTWLLTHALGYRRAKAVALLGGKISCEQALAWGLAWAVYGEDFVGQTDLLCKLLAQAPTTSLGYTKRAFYQAINNDFDTQLSHERDFQRLAGRSQDYREGVAAFLAKRDPQFTGE